MEVEVREVWRYTGERPIKGEAEAESLSHMAALLTSAVSLSPWRILLGHFLVGHH